MSHSLAPEISGSTHPTPTVCEGAWTLSGPCTAQAEFVVGIKRSCNGETFPRIYFCEAHALHLLRYCDQCGSDFCGVVSEPVRVATER